MKTVRKHLGWYCEAANGAPALRQRLLTARDPAEVLRLLPDALAPASDTAPDMEQAA